MQCLFIQFVSVEKGLENYEYIDSNKQNISWSPYKRDKIDSINPITLSKLNHGDFNNNTPLRNLKKMFRNSPLNCTYSSRCNVLCNICIRGAQGLFHV